MQLAVGQRWVQGEGWGFSEQRGLHQVGRDGSQQDTVAKMAGGGNHIGQSGKRPDERQIVRCTRPQAGPGAQEFTMG